MTDTPRRRPPAPTRVGTLSLKPRAAAPANQAPADAAPAAKPETRDWRKPATGAGRKRGKASFPEQANTEPVRRNADAGNERPSGDRPPRQDGDRPARPYADRPPRQDGERPARPFGERPPRAASDRPRGDRPTNQGGDRPARPEGERPPRHERKAWTGEPRPAPTPSPLRDDGSIRLSKRMTELGLCSRREADEYIEKGWVRVDGRVVSELGSRVKPGQQVELDRRGQTFQDRRVTILLNKPVGYVSGQAEDGYEPASVLITADNRWAEDPSETRYLTSHHKGLAPAGRLDIDSIGLLVFTQDGRIARALIGDDSSIEKEYHVRVEGTVDAAGLKLLNHGLSLDGVALRPAKVSWLNEDQLRFVLREGKKRQIRRMCELVGLKVIGLKRVRIGRVMLGHLPPGQWRYLGPDEVF
ncbi:MAG: pseudouridine synthase [Zoogloea sp.]|uniref:pseudouridine synthase n=1 Tax=Zoogloea sp. TaxID=49181 RepID=UPI00262CD7A1|nr:pseudouridine synthase [Zoogloea sp.]MDD2987508.1 pseudouridine synthase [Zoogloea sp.]